MEVFQKKMEENVLNAKIEGKRPWVGEKSRRDRKRTRRDGRRTTRDRKTIKKKNENRKG
jgi:hypothetical protein